jgi:hypothetical protein
MLKDKLNNWLELRNLLIFLAIPIIELIVNQIGCDDRIKSHKLSIVFAICLLLFLVHFLQLPEKSKKKYTSIRKRDWLRYLSITFLTTSILDTILDKGFSDPNDKTIIFRLVIIVILFYINPLSNFFKTTTKILKFKVLRIIDFIWWIGLRLVSPFEFKYYQYFIKEFSKFQGFKINNSSEINLPDLDLDKVFIPLEVGLRDKFEQNHKIWNFLGESGNYPSYRRMAIIASPGSGKSTLVEHLALTYAKNKQRQYHPNAPRLIPILLYLRSINKELAADKLPDLAQLIEKQFKSLKPPVNWFDKNLKNGKFLVMLDGLDEVASDRRRIIISNWINEQIKKYPKNIFIVTSRPFGYQKAPLEKIKTILEIRPLQSQQVEKFIQTWYLETEIYRRGKDKAWIVKQKAKDKAHNLINQITKFEALKVITTKPLLVNMIATVDYYSDGALPIRRVELYSKICDVLLEKVQKVTKDKSQLLLQVLALQLKKLDKSREFQLDDGCNILKEELERSGVTFKPEKFIDEIERHTSLLVAKGNDVYEFAHHSIQEYFAAVAVKELNQENILIENLEVPAWSETIRLYAGLGDASNIIEEIIKNPTDDTLTLACYCLEESLSIRPEVVKKLRNTLEAKNATQENSLISSLLARTQLSPRIREEHLQTIYEIPKVEIDTKLITCQEYQLFIENTQKKGKYHQPDHWKDYIYPRELENQPIAGVRLSDAKEFCIWLTQKHYSQGYKYRLPTINEAENNPIEDNSIGYWCSDGDKYILGGLSDSQRKDLLKQLSQALIDEGYLNIVDYHQFNLDCLFNWDIEQIFQKNFQPDFYSQFNHFFNRKLYRDLQRIIDSDFYEDIHIDLNRQLIYKLNSDLKLITSRNLGKNLDYKVYQELYLYLCRSLSLDFNLLVNQNLYRENFSDLRVFNKSDFYERFLRFPYQKIESEEASNFQILYLPLILVIVICYLLIIIYQLASQKPEILKSMNLTSKECHDIIDKYTEQIIKVFPSYAFLVLLDERLNQRISAWEGIRIIREKV